MAEILQYIGQIVAIRNSHNGSPKGANSKPFSNRLVIEKSSITYTTLNSRDDPVTNTISTELTATFTNMCVFAIVMVH